MKLKLRLRVANILFSLAFLCFLLMSNDLKACDGPENINFLDVDGSLSLEWDPVVGASNYEVTITNESGAFFLSASTGTPLFSTSLPVGTYTIVVTTLCDDISGTSTVLKNVQVPYSDVYVVGAYTIMVDPDNWMAVEINTEDFSLSNSCSIEDVSSFYIKEIYFDLPFYASLNIDDNLRVNHIAFDNEFGKFDMEVKVNSNAYINENYLPVKFAFSSGGCNYELDVKFSYKKRPNKGFLTTFKNTSLHQNTDVHISPNPTSNGFHLSLNCPDDDEFAPEPESILFKLYHPNGALLLEESYDNACALEEYINITDLPNGIYLAQIQTNTGRNVTKRVLKF